MSKDEVNELRSLRAQPAALTGLVRAALTPAWVVSLAFSAWVVVREAAADHVLRQVEHQLDQPKLQAPAPACLAPCPARTLEALALAETRAAATAPASHAAPALERARTYAQGALARNPMSPTGWVLLSQSQERETEASQRTALATLATSYQAAPFDPGVAGYRVNYVLNHWSAASKGLRRSALDEGVWLATARPALLEQLRASPHDPAAQYALELALSQAD
jgi:hypothetical protein